MNHLLKLGLVLAVLTACGCAESYTEWSLRLHNGCDSSAVHLRALSTEHETFDLVVPAGAPTAFMVLQDVGGESGPSSVGRFLDACILTRHNEADTCLKEVFIDANWQITTEQTHRRPANYEHTYTFSVSEGDF